MTALHTLAFEIGTEEIPAFDLDRATKALPKLTERLLDEAAIPHGEIEVASTPRRLITIVRGIPTETPAFVEEHKGPSAAIAFDGAGELTKAALGFARSKGVDPAELEVRNVDGTGYVYAVKSVPAVQIVDLLPALLEGIVTGLEWPRSCRWGSRSEYFSRPIRWFVALLDDQVVDFSYAGLAAGRATKGHRVLSPGFHDVATAEELIPTLATLKIAATEAAREALVREGVAQIEAETGLTARLPEKTLLEVVNLCEAPTPLLGTFDEEFLAVPEEIVVDAMLMHQRYFPLYTDAGKLSNRFVIVSNGDPTCAPTIVDGNERVVRARLSDAKFFYDEDLKAGLEACFAKLGTVVFQEQLGTVADKVARIEALCTHLATAADLSAADAADLMRAAHLAKADLTSNAVVEFTSVQGVMGCYYARAAGETDQVCTAIAEHYRPRFSGDALPASTVGRLLAFADKLDTICGLFACGQSPTGSSDPFALRRSALGIIAMLEDALPVSLSDAIDASLDLYQREGGSPASSAGSADAASAPADSERPALAFDREAVRAEVVDFFVTRTKVLLKDRGIDVDLIEAVVAAGIAEPAEIAARARALADLRAEQPQVLEDLSQAYARAANLLADAGSEHVGAEPAQALACEKALADAVAEASTAADVALSQGDHPAAFAALAKLREPVDAFFEEVKVMDDDPAVRAARLALLERFVAAFRGAADFSKLAK